MAETLTPTKRDRNDDNDKDIVSQIEPQKRHKNSYINNSFSSSSRAARLIYTPDNKQREATQDLLEDFFTNLPSDPFLDFTHQPEPDPDDNLNPNPKQVSGDDDDEKDSVIRHLLEASDDELGIPSRVDGGGDVGDGGDDFSGSGYGDYPFGLWEIEDEAANYFTLLQSELFMQ